jgi:type IV pilus modification protein PilV
MSITAQLIKQRYRRENGIGLIELLIALLLFGVCIVALSQMQIKTGMQGLDNHQRAIALWSARGLIDRISANSSDEGITEYQTRIAAINDCQAFSVKQCESVPSGSEVSACSPSELAAHDVWSTFCEGEDSLSSQLIDYQANLTCDGPCTADSNMTLRLSWISRVSDSDRRLKSVTTDTTGTQTPSNFDFITLEFRP